MPVPDRIQRIVDAVEASRSDDDLRAMAGDDGRLITTLICERERLRDPVHDQFDAAVDRLRNAHAGVRHAHQTGDAAEIAAAEIELAQARWAIEAAMRQIEQRNRDAPPADKSNGWPVSVLKFPPLAVRRRRESSRGAP